MSKKKDVFGKKLKLTRQEKRDHKSRMEKFESISLYWTQIQRLFDNLYKSLVDMGSLVFPNQQIRLRLFRFAIRLIAKFWWLILTPTIYQLISIQSTTHAFSNSFFY